MGVNAVIQLLLSYRVQIWERILDKTFVSFDPFPEPAVHKWIMVYMLIVKYKCKFFCKLFYVINGSKINQNQTNIGQIDLYHILMLYASYDIK